jgi:cbb3-type cytochrome oxidase maturation protein
MAVILFLAVAAISVAAGFLGAFFWATKNGQYDDTSTPAMRMLFDNPVKPPIIDEKNHTSK